MTLRMFVIIYENLIVMPIYLDPNKCEIGLCSMMGGKHNYLYASLDSIMT
jgi:hypothetical protein